MSRYEFFEERNDLVQANAYKFIKKLGEGSYSVVFLAEFNDVSHGMVSLKQTACKVIDTAKAPADYTKKFLPRELELLRKLNHPHIVHVYAIYKRNSKYLIFMRYAENGDLLDFIYKTGPISESQTRMWTKQISLAVQYLHELEIAHRDLKCENVLVTANFNVKLSDFGFSKIVISKSGMRTLSVTYCGSTSYCAPEVLKGIPYNPKISDIWSLGVIIYVMLNKAMPFDSVQIKRLYEQQIKKKWKFRPEIEYKVSREVKDLLHNILEPNVNKRLIISEVLNSEWFFMDHRLLGMSEEESLALLNAKEERRKMEEDLWKTKNPGVQAKKMR